MSSEVLKQRILVNKVSKMITVLERKTSDIAPRDLARFGKDYYLVQNGTPEHSKYHMTGITKKLEKKENYDVREIKLNEDMFVTDYSDDETARDELWGRSFVTLTLETPSSGILRNWRRRAHLETEEQVRHEYYKNDRRQSGVNPEFEKPRTIFLETDTKEALKRAEQVVTRTKKARRTPDL